ncbi:hypothetical protein PV735_36480 [Streptomyces turgidiscabies]|uniref:Uncharacterized protein n=1 Tax=Streptomyces turgidiscabies (strain Car8) TaxID=698760 RepID=L7ETY3_STRT8|nr:hypothetical protein [Streptomyces turgidiscabies]ELP62146.1 hypothetical protein STRTUCAR8_00210 [Streptomyces turgidiscabies Car8]MDX3498142.1 hypothetical protein [Streptomyces turgidiscabies]
MWRDADAVDAAALEAAQAQQTAFPGEHVAGQIVADLALEERLRRIEQQIREARSEAITRRGSSSPCPIPGPEFIIAAGDLASAVGLVPVPRGSGHADQHHPRGTEPGLLPQAARGGLQARPGVLWALLREGRVFTSAPPVTQAA